VGRNIEEVIKQLPKARQDRINDEARRMALEMIRHSESLVALRKASGQTQAEVAATLGIGQNAVSQLESRTDLYLSTLSKYVGALGLQLELALVTSEGERVALPNFRPWDLSEPAPVAKPRFARKKTTASTATKAVTAKRAAGKSRT
jgi:transcriptional regulator with XRE-family HTH domain